MHVAFINFVYAAASKKLRSPLPLGRPRWVTGFPALGDEEFPALQAEIDDLLKDIGAAEGATPKPATFRCAFPRS
jgi:hypothetical protein